MFLAVIVLPRVSFIFFYHPLSDPLPPYPSPAMIPLTMSTHAPSVPKLRRALLLWYTRHKRDLPWRRTRNPYKIWVSEIMLQQTQVATVIPYYKRWLKVFPSLSAFARAPLSKAMSLWAGLGYYRRVRMFHQAANCIRRERGGKIPRTAEELKKLPGIGRYTAGAIASIAWGEKTPVLDGNVIRVLTRLFAVAQSVDRPKTLERLWSIATLLLPNKDPGDLNQSLMELGAMVCSPLTPRCGQCPVKKSCAARKKGKPLSYPVRSQTSRYEKLSTAALVLRNEKDELWIEKQSAEARWGGLWAFPFWASKKEMLKESRPFAQRPAPLLTVPHALTKYRVTLEVFESKSRKGRSPKRVSGRWFSAARLKRLAFPSPHGRIVQVLMERDRPTGTLFPKRVPVTKAAGSRLT